MNKNPAEGSVYYTHGVSSQNQNKMTTVMATFVYTTFVPMTYDTTP